jgi:hypothetical protein
VRVGRGFTGGRVGRRRRSPFCVVCVTSTITSLDVSLVVRGGGVGGVRR